MRRRLGLGPQGGQARGQPLVECDDARVGHQLVGQVENLCFVWEDLTADLDLILRVHVQGGHGRDPAIAEVAQEPGAGRSVAGLGARDVVQQRGRFDQAGVQVQPRSG